MFVGSAVSGSRRTGLSSWAALDTRSDGFWSSTGALIASMERAATANMRITDRMVFRAEGDSNLRF